jgi:hypothetical protein
MVVEMMIVYRSRVMPVALKRIDHVLEALEARDSFQIDSLRIRIRIIITLSKT